MKNSEYWAQRFTQLEDAQNQQGASALIEIEKQYRQAQKQIEGQISTWYQRFAKNNGITLAEARQWLTGKDLKEFKWDVQDYIKYGQDNALSGGWMKELENASAKYHISKLEALKIHTQQSLESLFSKQGLTLSGAMGDVYTSGYYHTIYELQKGFNVGWDIAGIDEAQLEKVLAKPWAADGYNFSERIWNNKNKLIQEVHTELSQNIMLGADPQKAIDSLAKKMNTSKHNAGRLVMTEEAYFSSTAQKEAFQELGVEQFEIVATLDSHTSEICRMMDGQHFPMTDFQPGSTAPPFHVYCRSTTAPYFDDDFGQIGERAARDEETGKTYYIPDDMKYQDWEDAFVKGGDKSGFDVLDDGSALHYSHHKEPEPEPQKKVYLTEKKLKSLIADADVQLEDLDNAFSGVAFGYTHEQAIKDFNGDIDKFANDLFPGEADKIQKLKDLHSQMEALEKQKEEWTVKLNEKLIAKQKKALAKQQLDLEAQKAAIQQQLDDIEVKTYSGIWYGKDVTTADWKGLNIAGKKSYYQSEIAKGTLDPAKQAQFEEYLKQLDELDLEGKSYADIQAELQKVQSDLQKVQSDLQKLENGGIMDAVDDAFKDAYSQARKDAALWFDRAHGGFNAADNYFDPPAKAVHAAATRQEHKGFYTYTEGSGGHNRPLAGFEKRWSDPGSGWEERYYKGAKNVWIDFEGKGDDIRGLTSLIEKSTYDSDVWLQSGQGFQTLEGFLQIPYGSLQKMNDAQLQQFVGRRNVIYNFISTAVNEGDGSIFNSKPMKFNIYAPKGSQMLYASDVGAFGKGENELILQRGGTYEITRIYWGIDHTDGNTRKIFVDMEIHPEAGYDTFQQDPNEWTGSKKNYRS